MICGILGIKPPVCMSVYCDVLVYGVCVFTWFQQYYTFNCCMIRQCTIVSDLTDVFPISKRMTFAIRATFNT